MIIDRIYLNVDQVCVVVQGYEDYHLVFDLQTVPNVDRLIQLIKTKIAEIDEGPHTPPTTDWTPFFETLKTASRAPTSENDQCGKKYSHS